MDDLVSNRESASSQAGRLTMSSKLSCLLNVLYSGEIEVNSQLRCTLFHRLSLSPYIAGVSRHFALCLCVSLDKCALHPDLNCAIENHFLLSSQEEEEVLSFGSLNQTRNSVDCLPRTHT